MNRTKMLKSEAGNFREIKDYFMQHRLKKRERKEKICTVLMAFDTPPYGGYY